MNRPSDEDSADSPPNTFRESTPKHLFYTTSQKPQGENTINMRSIRIEVRGSILNTPFSGLLQEETFGAAVIVKSRPQK